MPEKYKPRVEQVNIEDINIDNLTPAILDQLADHLLKKALGDNPAAVEEAKRRFAAAECPTVEEITRAIEEPKG